MKYLAWGAFVFSILLLIFAMVKPNIDTKVFEIPTLKFLENENSDFDNGQRLILSDKWSMS